MKMLNAYSEATQFVKGIEAFLCIMSGKLWSEDQIWPTTCYVNKALLEHITFTCLHIS